MGPLFRPGKISWRVFPKLLFLSAMLTWESSPALSAWNSVAGIKEGTDTVSELSNPWDGERLLAFGGTLNFAGNVSLEGELWLQQMNGWGNPIVNIPGTLTMSSPSSQFRVVDGADFNIGNALASSVETGTMTINGGSQVTVENVIVHDIVELSNSGTLLHALGDFAQGGGSLLLNGDAAFEVDGIFTKTGSGDFSVHSPHFSIGNAAASSVEAGAFEITSGIELAIGEVITHGNVDIRHEDSSLRVLGDYYQNAGDFRVWFGGNIDVDGTFTKTGSGSFEVVHTSSTFNAAQSYIEAGVVNIRDATQVTVGEMLVHGNTDVHHPDTVLHILGDYIQDNGYFSQSGDFIVDGVFTKTGNGDFISVGSDQFHLANLGASSVEAGHVEIGFEASVMLGELTTHNDTRVFATGTSLHILGNYTQDEGGFYAYQGASFQVDGTFTKTGMGEFVTHGNGKFIVGNPTGSSVEASNVEISADADVTLNSLTTHGNALVSGGATFHLLGNYIQSAGSFTASQVGTTFDVEGVFTKSGIGDFILYDIDLIPGNAAASQVEAGNISLAFNSGVTIGDLTAHNDVHINNGAQLHVLGDYFQDGGLFRFEHSSTEITIGGAFNKTGDGDFVVHDNALTPDNTMDSNVEAGNVSIANAEVTIGSLSAHNDVYVTNGTQLHVLGDYFQDGGLFRFEHGSTEITIGGAFVKTGSNEFVVHDNGLIPGNAMGSHVEAGHVSLANAEVTVGSLTAHSDVYVTHGTKLQILGDYLQDGGNFFLQNANAVMSIDGSLWHTAGQTFAVQNASILTTSNTTSGITVANSVIVDSGGRATISNLTAHGNVTVSNPTSLLRVGGDYFQDVGGLVIGDNATLNVDGSFRFAVAGTQFINFGNGFLRVGDTLTLAENHYWNLGTSGGRVRVGDGLTVPVAGTFEITSNGTLAGEGTIIGNLTNAGGIVSPGNSTGRLDVTGSYIQGSTSTLSVEIGGTLAELQYDQFFISGTASLAGSLTVDLLDLGAGTFAPSFGDTFDILKAGSGRSGTFSVLDLPSLSSGLDWQVNYLPNFVQLEVIASVGIAGDFDLDGDVDGRDFLFWQRDPGVGNLTDWQTGYGTEALSVVTAVPEPSFAIMVVIVLGACSARRHLCQFIQVTS
jgi:hypothetical protein